MRADDFRPIWYMNLAVIALALAALWLNGVHVRPGPWGVLYAWLAAICLLANMHCERMPEIVRRALLFLNGLLLFTTISLAGLLVSYWIARTTSVPFADAWLYAADRMLGFDWRVLYDRHVANPWIHLYTRLSYTSISHTPLVLCIALAVAGLDRHLRNFLLVHGLALAVTMSIFILLPAQAALAYLVGTEPPYMPITGINAGPTIAGLRDGTMTDFQFHTLAGLVTFPSYHSVAAIIYIWAAWPLRYLRWPLLFINGSMLISTPIEGTHYLVDVVGGMLIAVGSIAAVQAFDRIPRPVTWSYRSLVPRLARSRLA